VVLHYWLPAVVSAVSDVHGKLTAHGRRHQHGTPQEHKRQATTQYENTEKTSGVNARAHRCDVRVVAEVRRAE
jgi:hypothetical protein